VPGRLYIVATPLGNLEDLSPRAARVLAGVALVAAEDTRTVQHLYARIGARPATVSYFEGNEEARAGELLARLAAGDDVALVSEAGMPGISDPGERLVRRAVAAGIAVEVVPGPSAVTTALVGSGLPSGRFSFVGFLPRAAGERAALLARLRDRDETLVFYEAPSRTAATLADLAAMLGDGRRACIARELTKVHEEYLRGTLGELAARAATAPPRGEVTLVVEGAPAGAAAAPPLDVEAEVDARLARGESPKELAAALALATGKPRRQIYQLALARRRRVEDP
jgi:16S rRNA (cytidine1402-2'-O)-methyltransferase